MSKTAYEWLIETRDAHSNEAVSRYLVNASTRTGVVCKDKKKRDFWVCESKPAQLIDHCREQSHLKISIFVRRLPNGVPYPWRFTAKARQQLAARRSVARSVAPASRYVAKVDHLDQPV